MERLVGPGGEIAVHGDQVERPRDLAGDDDLVLAQPRLERELGRLQRGEDHALVDDLLGGLAEVAVGVLLHLLHDELLVQGAAVDADAHGLPVVRAMRQIVANCSSRRAPFPTLPGLIRYLSRRPRHLRELRQEDVPVVVEVADEGRFDARGEHPPLDLGNGLRGLGDVDRDAHHLRARPRELDALAGRRGDVGRVRVGHRLDDDRGAAADLDGTHGHPDGGVAFSGDHGLFQSTKGQGTALPRL